MDIKKIILEAAEKIMKDEKLQNQFKKDPVKALEKVLGVDLPDEMLDPVIDGIKAKMTAEKLEDAVGFVKGLLKK